jgi:hypothetical protein
MKNSNKPQKGCSACTLDFGGYNLTFRGDFFYAQFYNLVFKLNVQNSKWKFPVRLVSICS